MTSNLGSAMISELENADTAKEDIQQSIDSLLLNHFKPEFLNRVDETIIFDSLTKENLMVIVDIQLKRLSSRLKAQHLEIHIRESAKSFLVEKGYNQAFGARPLKRTIQQEIENPLAMMILEGGLQENRGIERRLTVYNS